MIRFEMGGLDLIHGAHRCVVGAMCDYESFRGSSEGKSDGTGNERHHHNALVNAKTAIKQLQDFIAFVEKQD